MIRLSHSVQPLMMLGENHEGCSGERGQKDGRPQLRSKFLHLSSPTEVTTRKETTEVRERERAKEIDKKSIRASPRPRIRPGHPSSLSCISRSRATAEHFGSKTAVPAFSHILEHLVPVSNVRLLQVTHTEASACSLRLTSST